jgi:GATA-binding protein
MFDGVLHDGVYHSPSMPNFTLRQPSPSASMNGHLEPPLPYDTLAAQNTALKTRVNELEVINDLFRGRVSELENTEQGAREREAQLRAELEEVKLRESDLKRRLEEYDEGPRHKKMRLSDLVDESRAGSPISSMTE